MKYIGFRTISAEPMTLREYMNTVGSMQETGDMLDAQGYIITYSSGVTAWALKEDFELMYMPEDNLPFGTALSLMKHGFKLTRKGWNGKGMFVVYQKGYPDGIPCNKQTAEAWGMQEGDLFRCNPYLQIRCADGSHSMWVPSINDCLANDWEVVEDCSSVKGV